MRNNIPVIYILIRLVSLSATVTPHVINTHHHGLCAYANAQVHQARMQDGRLAAIKVRLIYFTGVV